MWKNWLKWVFKKSNPTIKKKQKNYNIEKQNNNNNNDNNRDNNSCKNHFKFLFIFDTSFLD